MLYTLSGYRIYLNGQARGMVTGSKNWTGLEGLNSNSKYRSAFVLFLFFKLLPAIQYYFFPVLKNTRHSLELL